MEANRLVGESLRMALQMEANPLVGEAWEEKGRVRMALPLQQMEARQRMGLLLLMLRKMTSSLSEAVRTEAREKETETQTETATREAVCKQQHQNQKPDAALLCKTPTLKSYYSKCSLQQVEIIYITDSSLFILLGLFFTSYWTQHNFFFFFTSYFIFLFFLFLLYFEKNNKLVFSLLEGYCIQPFEKSITLSGLIWNNMVDKKKIGII